MSWNEGRFPPRPGPRYRVHCIGRLTHDEQDLVSGTTGSCGWAGYRKDGECECYDEYAWYCRPGSPGPGCPRGIAWPCPRCDGGVRVGKAVAGR